MAGNTTGTTANAERAPYAGVAVDKTFPKHRIVFKSGKHLNLFGVTKVNLDGSWTRVWDGRGKVFMYDPGSVDYIEIDDGPAK